jgi:transcriptional regulator with XRE-family HTH domain
MPRSHLTAAVGVAVRALRQERRGLSQEDLAELAGVHRTYLGVLERGTANPTIATLDDVARALGVRVSDIVLRAEGRLQGTPSGFGGWHPLAPAVGSR